MSDNKRLYHRLYNSLVSEQRVLTRQFWENVRGLTWTTISSNNLIHDVSMMSYWNGATQVASESAANYFKIENVRTADLFKLANSFNQLVIDAIAKDEYMDGQMPTEAFPAQLSINGPFLNAEYSPAFPPA